MVKNKQQGPPPRRKPRSKRMNRNNQKNGQSTGFYLPTWVKSIAMPFTSPGSHIPDNATDNSGLCSSFATYTGAASTSTGASGTTHSFGFLLPPFPYYTMFSDAANGTCTDLNTGGTQYLTPFAGSAQNTPIAVPNIDAILGTTAAGVQRSRIRCVGIGVTVDYEGTELQRSGKYIAAIVPISGMGTAVATTGTKLGLVGACLSGSTAVTDFNATALKQQAIAYTEQRVGNTPFSARWIPNGVPSYQLSAGTPEYYTTTGGAAPTVPYSIWQSAKGGPGVESGQHCLVVGVFGDITGSSSASSNPYTVNIKWHWEVIPDTYSSVAYELQPSVSNNMILDKCINLFSKLTVCPDPGNGSSGA